MMPKVPSLTNLRAVTPSRRPSQCNAALALDIGHLLQQEATVEGVLHVSAPQAHSCMERFEDLQVLSAPTLPQLNNILQEDVGTDAHSAVHSPAPASSLSGVSSTTERTIKEAFCLATPPDAPTDEPILRQQTGYPARDVTAAAAGSNNSSTASSNASRVAEPPVSTGMRRLPGRTPSTSDLLHAAEESAQLELAAAQQAAMKQIRLNNELTRTTEAVARHRRRKLLRLLRSTQDAGQGLLSAWQRSEAAVALASIGGSFASLASLASLDDAGDMGSAGDFDDNHDSDSMASKSDEDDAPDFSSSIPASWFGCRASNTATGSNPGCAAT